VNEFKAYQTRNQDGKDNWPAIASRRDMAREGPDVGVMSPKPVVVKAVKL
jgi:hypothetical protein